MEPEKAERWLNSPIGRDKATPFIAGRRAKVDLERNERNMDSKKNAVHKKTRTHELASEGRQKIMTEQACRTTGVGCSPSSSLNLNREGGKVPHLIAKKRTKKDKSSLNVEPDAQTKYIQTCNESTLAFP